MNTSRTYNGNIAKLVDRGVVRISGPDRLEFLQNLLTCDLNLLHDSELLFGGLLSPQGKLLFDFFIMQSEEAVLVDIQNSILEDFINRISLYRLRANIGVENLSESHKVVAFWNCKGEAAASFSAFEDPRLPELGYRTISNLGVVENTFKSTEFRNSALEEYHQHRIHLGVPSGEYDFSYGSVFPHDVNMDILNGIDFSKGCFVGQEVVSRMKHRGTARKRIVIAKATAVLPDAGTEILSGGKAIGKLGGNAGNIAIAQVRIDRVQNAIDSSESIKAGDLEISLELPNWVDFNWQ